MISFPENTPRILLLIVSSLLTLHAFLCILSDVLMHQLEPFLQIVYIFDPFLQDLLSTNW